MLAAGFYGLVTGVLLCLTFGTVFFSLVQNSVDNGYRSGIKIAFGVVVCDAIFVFFAIFGTALFPHVENFEKWMAGAGIVFLLILGLNNLLRNQPQIAYPKSKFGNFIFYFSTGFLLNGLNPVNFISWVTIATYVRSTLHYDLNQISLFFGVSLLAILLTESGIALSAHRLKKIFTPRVAKIFNQVTGVVFIGIACQIAYSVFL
jgi:threonine/homoserine/homoserine lactone efflux protein